MNKEEQARAEHYRMVRENPDYRNFLREEYLEVLMSPSLCQDVEKPEEPDIPHIPELSKILTHKIKKLGELEGRLIYLQGKLNEHIAYSKPKDYY